MRNLNKYNLTIFKKIYHDFLISQGYAYRKQNYTRRSILRGTIVITKLSISFYRLRITLAYEIDKKSTIYTKAISIHDLYSFPMRDYPGITLHYFYPTSLTPQVILGRRDYSVSPKLPVKPILIKEKKRCR